VITSTQNALIKRIRRLQQKKHRLREGAFFVEGLRVVLTALEEGAPIETIVWCDALLRSEIGRNAITADLPTVEVSETVFRTITDRDTPSGLGAIIKFESAELNSFHIRPDSVFIALENIADPGNLGTIIRTVDAAGASGVILIGDTTDPTHPTALKASMGALFAVPIAFAPSLATVIAWAHDNDVQVVATSAKAETFLWDAPLQTPLLWLLGSERHGLSAEGLDSAEIRVSLPMHGVSSSLNLAVAAGLLLYEMRRRVA
jgi:TrmH family RNA methyltransferase